MRNMEEKLREAASLGDIEAVEELVKRGINVNAKHDINGCGADPSIQTDKGETPLSVCADPNIRQLLGGSALPQVGESNTTNFIPNYIRNAPLNGQVDIGPRRRLHHAEIASMPSTNLPACGDELVLRIRIAGIHDPDFIEVEIQKTQLTYSALLAICCSELSVNVGRIERIRKLPDTRLRNDSDVKRLSHMQSLEIVLKPPVPSLPYSTHNGYQSITSHKDQTILY